VTSPDRALSLRERKKLRTRQALADTALGLCVSKGFDAMTLDELVDSVEVSKRTFFRHFASKEDAVFTPGRQLWTAVLADLTERPLTGRLIDLLRDTLIDTVQSMDERVDGHEQPWSDRFLTLELVESTPALRAYGLAYCADVCDEAVRLLSGRLGTDDGGLALRMVVELWITGWHVGSRGWRSTSGEGGAAGLSQHLLAVFDVLADTLTLSASPRS